MSGRRYLVVNADDFGQSHGVNSGIAVAHETGIVTSASLMVRWPAAREAAAYAAAHPQLGVGLHLDLGEWMLQRGEWVARYEVVDLHADAALREELRRQLQSFRKLTGRDPTHLDSHQNVHLREPLRTEASALAERLGVPLRSCSPGVAHIGDFYGQTWDGLPAHQEISAERLIGLLSATAAGASELGCHPGLGEDLDTTYLRERRLEVQTLCDPAVRDAIDRQGIQLRSFSQLPASV